MNEWPEEWGDPSEVYDFTRLGEFENAPTRDFAFYGFYPLDDDVIMGQWRRVFGAGGEQISPLSEARKGLTEAANQLQPYSGDPPQGYREAARFVLDVDAVEYTASSGFTRQFGRIVFDVSSGEYVVLIPMDSKNLTREADPIEDDIPF